MIEAKKRGQPKILDVKRLLQEETPRLRESKLLNYVRDNFNRRQEFLAPLQEMKSPLYLFDQAALTERAKQFTAAFKGQFERPKFYYAVKSNNYPGIAGLLLANGFGLDVSSGEELGMAISLKAQDVLFSGPGKTVDELRLAIRKSERLIVLIDSFQELANLARLTAEMQVNLRVGVRLTTNPEGLWRKFGILPERLPEFMTAVRRCPYLDFKGIQFHTSWNLAATAQVSFLQLLGGILGQMSAEERAGISFIDMGGGYWPEMGEWLQPAGTEAGQLRKALHLESCRKMKHYCLDSISIEEFAAKLGRAAAKWILPLLPLCQFCFEPGRWLCNDSMHILLTVIDKKSDDMVITDAGTNAVGWERFEIDYFPVLNLSRPSMDEKSCYILGALCTPHDVWGYNYWGESISVGDVLLIPSQGAYTYSLRQNFIKPLPMVAAISPL